MLIVRYIVIATLLFCGSAFAENAKPAAPELGRTAVIETSKGTIKIGLYEKDAPVTTKNFVELIERKFYDGLTFHRVIEDILIQGGDPQGTGMGGSEKKIKLEVSEKLKHDAPGVVAMARRPDPDFDSGTSQFYITMIPLPRLDMGYAVFGRVIDGMDVVKKIEKGDTMKTVRLAPAPKPETKPQPKKTTAPKKPVKKTVKK